MSRRRLATVVLPLLVYTAATVYCTWPLARVGARQFLSEDGVMKGDVLLIVWILRWDLHALGTHPAGLYDANAFHPVPRILTSSEHLLGVLPVFGPVWAATGNPILALNVTTFLSFVLAGCGMHLLVRRWTGSTAAAYAAGLTFACAWWRLLTIPVPHTLYVQYFPLVLLGLERTAATGRLRPALLTAAALTLQIGRAHV